jgi:ligand-binding sensor domain-containing protein/signal transduction histidine kinase
LQDSKGFLWIGTANGLNKYDGNEFTVYKHDPEDPNSLSSDMIYSIAEDKKGNLWVGTENNLNMFDPAGKKFSRCPGSDDNPAKGKMVYSIAIDGKEKIWTGTQGEGLINYDPATKKSHSYKNSPAGIPNSSLDYIRCIKIDEKGIIWLATQGGLSSFDPIAGKFKNYRELFLKRNPSLKKEVFALTLDKEGIIWFTADGSLNRYDAAKDELKSYTTTGNAKNNNFRTWALLDDSRGNIWLGTGDNGILIFSRKNHTFTAVKNNPVKPHSLSENSVMALLEDRGGVIWIGTFTGGLNKFTGNKNKFQHFKHDPENSNTITPGLVYAMYEDRAGNLWVGTTGGLNKVERGGKVTRFRNIPGNKKSLSSNMVTGIKEDKNGDLWITTQGGLNRYNRKSNDFTTFTADTSRGSRLPVNRLGNLYIDDEGIIWIGTFFNGMIRFDPVKEIFTHYSFEEGKKGSISSDHISCITEDNNGSLLLASGTGLNVFDKAAGRVTELYKTGKSSSSLNVDQLLYVFNDDDGIIWIGTYGGGLNKLDRKNKKTEYFSEKKGLPNNVVYGILPDETGNLWLSTNKGLVKFNKASGRVRVYDPSDGLQSYEFNSNAFCKGRSGEMFFGGVNGYNAFFPAGVQDNSSVPPVVITAVYSLSKIIKEEITGNANNPEELSYSDNFLTFDFVSLDYTNTRCNKYSYKLEGFDKGWIDAGNRRFAMYTNLPPGEYTFFVRGSNSDDVWNNAGASFNFIINPPFYRTWWFYLLSFVLLAGIVLSVHKYRVRMKIKQIVEIEKMRKKIADDFHDELGHKLTKISLYSELMRQELSSSIQDVPPVQVNDNEDYLKKINEAANKLFDDTKDFIWSIDPVKDTLYDLAVYLKDFGDEFFDRTGIAFRVNEISTDLAEINLPMDWKRQLILIFKEAMNNCLRHSECKNAGLSVTASEDKIEIILRDDGSGFPVNSGSRGRGVINMKARAEKIGAELFIESTPGSGTLILFSGSRQSIGDKQKHKRQ